MIGFGVIFTLLVIALIIYTIGSRQEILAKGISRELFSTPPENIISRYSRGEISKEGFLQLLRDRE